MLGIRSELGHSFTWITVMEGLEWVDIRIFSPTVCVLPANYGLDRTRASWKDCESFLPVTHIDEQNHPFSFCYILFDLLE